jgi:hypothetical protein
VITVSGSENKKRNERLPKALKRNQKKRSKDKKELLKHIKGVRNILSGSYTIICK